MTAFHGPGFYVRHHSRDAWTRDFAAAVQHGLGGLPIRPENSRRDIGGGVDRIAVKTDSSPARIACGCDGG